MKRLRNILILVMSILVLAACSKSVEDQIAEQLELGQRCLSEMKYDDAIVAFNKIIELDEKNIEAYLGIASAYKGLGNFDGAIEILQEGKRQEENIKIILELFLTQYEAGYIYEEAENYTKASEMYERASNLLCRELVNANPEKVREYVQRMGEFYVDQNEIDKFDLFWEQVIAANIMNEDLYEIKDTQYGSFPVLWDDQALEAMIRKEIGILDGTVYVRDLDKITELDIWGNTHCIANADQKRNQNEDVPSVGIAIVNNSTNKVKALYSVIYYEGDERKSEYGYERGDIYSIEALRYFRNLKSVWIIAQHISDISVLKKINIESFCFYANEIPNYHDTISKMHISYYTVKEINGGQFIEVGNEWIDE